MIYELREYKTSPHRMDRLHQRFVDAAIPTWERHGITVVAFWTDVEDPNRVLYILSFPDAEARKKAWEGFRNDPEWKAAKEATEYDGELVEDRAVTVMNPTPYSPLQ